MRAVVQRVSWAAVTVGDKRVSEIESGLLILLGVGLDDTVENARRLAAKTVKMRIFSDLGGKMNLSLRDVGGEILCVSQFTLLADTRKGNRPSFINAAKGELAESLYLDFCNCLAAEDVPVKQGVFGADMKVELLNDGPVTIVLDI